MSQTLEKTLLAIAKKLNLVNANWALTGESSLKVWGVDILPKNINIVINKSPQFGLEKIKFKGVFIPVYSLETELKNNKKNSTKIKNRIKELEASDDYGYVQVDVSDKSKLLLHKEISKCVKPSQYYNSKTISYIRGDVTAKAHLTVCYGVKNVDLHERLRMSKMVVQNPKESKISKIDFWPGFQNEYYLVFAVPEENKELYKLDRWIRKNNDIYEKSLSFEPHISMCYIKNTLEISIEDIVTKLSKSLVRKTIEFEGVSFFKPITEEKKTLSL